MFTRFEEAGPFVNVRSTLFDDPAGLEACMETMTAEKLPWASTPAVEGGAGFPQPEDFGRLMRGYAGR